MLRRIALCFLVSSSAFASPKEIRLTNGWIRGIEDEATLSYRGIPYAMPPRGTLRWQPPAPAEDWSGVRDATQYGPRCPQGSMFGKPTSAAPAFDFGAEDCLYLNVWVPQDADEAPLPVMVFIHGGGFDSGSGEGVTTIDHFYSGEKLAKHGGVIVVTLNYRLGALGFLAEPALAATSGIAGNYGLLDQIAALHWVQREIAAFGGDPHNVTVFGESSGAMSICALTAQVKHTGLFQRAIMQSGVCQARERERAEEMGTGYAALLGCDQEDLSERAACLRAAPVARVVKRQPSFSLAPYGRNPALELPWVPTVDGDFLPDFPVTLVERGEHQRVPMIIGTNEEELPPVIFSTILTAKSFTKMLARMAYGEDEKNQVAAIYAKKRYGSYTNASSALGTDIQFNCPSRALARGLVKHAPGSVYSYSFAKPAVEMSRHFFGTFHGVDMLFVFQKLSLRDVLQWGGKNRRLAETVGDYWTSFAKTGVPASSNGPEWRVFEAERGFQMRLDRAMAMVPAQRDAECTTLMDLSVRIDR